MFLAYREFITTENQNNWCNYSLPAVHHEFVYGPGAARGRRLAIACLYESENLVVSDVAKWLLGYRPDLKQYHTVAPYITMSRILLVE